MVQTIKDKNKKARLEIYRAIHEDVINSDVPTPWEYIAKKHGYKINSMKTIYYSRILPALKEEEKTGGLS